jgi:NAD(P)H-dependent flavin oxidoreductase YrpB (nitropropane dioxygenase family)
MRRHSRASQHLCELLKCNAPFIQAPMAGGPSTPELAAAVTKAGAVGAVASSYVTPVKFREDIKRIKALSKNRAFEPSITANFFVPSPLPLQVDWSVKENTQWLETSLDQLSEMMARCAVLLNLSREAPYEDLNAGHALAAELAFRRLSKAQAEEMAQQQRVLAKSSADLARRNDALPTAQQLVASQVLLKRNFEEAIVAAIEEKVTAASFVFGIPDEAVLRELRFKKIALIGTATTVEEAMQLRDAGFDAIVAQGLEAGGHRGVFSLPLCVDEQMRFSADAAKSTVFLNPANDPTLLNTCELVEAINDHLERHKQTSPLPIIAAGGIMSSDDIVSAMLRGAAGVQLGTAFLLSREAGTSPVNRRALREWGCGAARRPTIFTRAFSGRWARGLRNEMAATYENMPGSVMPAVSLGDGSPTVEEQLKKMMENAAPTKQRTPLPAEALAPFPLQNDAVGPVKRAMAAAAQIATRDANITAQCQLAAAEVSNVWAGSNVGLLRQYDNEGAEVIARRLITEANEMLTVTVRT